MSTSANLPAPYGGIDESIPVAVLKSPFCEDLTNFNVTQAGIELRNGDSLFSAATTPSSPSSSLILAQYNNTSLFFAVRDSTTDAIKIYNLETGATAYAPGNRPAGSLINYLSSLTYANYLFIFTADTTVKGYQYDGSTWAALGYTGTGFAPGGGSNVYKNRAYIPQFQEPAYWYSPIDSPASGALTKVNLSGVVSEVCYLCACLALTISDTSTTNTYQSFVFSNGEVLFYQGSYPDSDSWGLVARAKVAQLISINNSAFSYQGDALILTDAGLVSLRDLFLRGASAAQLLSVNTRVKKTWTELVRLNRAILNIPNGPYTTQIKGVYEDTGRIVVGFSAFPDGEGGLDSGAFFFVYDTVNAAWYFHKNLSFLPYLHDMIRYKNKTLLISAVLVSSVFRVITKEGGTDYQDIAPADGSSNSYQYNLTTAPIPFPKTAAYEAVQIEPILESDLFAETNWNFVVDFGRQTSGDQKTDALTTAVSKPAVNVGMQNITYVQVKMSGTTAANKTVGLDLYSFNVWYNAGATGSR